MFTLEPTQAWLVEVKLRHPQAERLIHWRPGKRARVALALATLAVVLARIVGVTLREGMSA